MRFPIRVCRQYVFRRIIVPILRQLASLLYDKKYLQGRYFDASLVVWGWVWRSLWMQKILGFNGHVPWPVSPSIAIDNPSGIIFDPDDMQNFNHSGCYFSNVNGGRITIGKGTVIALNVGIITTHHSLTDPSQHEIPQDVLIGEDCWLGMNCVILPGVHLGEHTIVGAGTIVTKSFPKGWCVLAGVPAKVIRNLHQ